MKDKEFKLYIVGGFLRDKFLGIKSKDIDYAFEFSEKFRKENTELTPVMAFNYMNSILTDEGFEIYKEHPECFTTKARFPDSHQYAGQDADIVLCRKETYKNPKSRKPFVEFGSLYDDLYRRDFTVNAMAIDTDGNLIDPFNGAEDLKNKILRCPKNAQTSFSEDYLRMIRAIRFVVTKDLNFNEDIWYALQKYENWDNLKDHVSTERVREEIYKCMKYDTIRTIRLLTDLEEECGNILNCIFSDGLWLKPTTEK